MKTYNKQSGFGVLELILTVVIIMGLGGIGWYVISSNHKTQQQLDSLAKSSDSTSASSKSSSSASSSDEFTFKELGVKIKLTDKLKGLAYTYVKNDSGSGGYAYLTSTEYKDALNQCPSSSQNGTDATNASFGAISRNTGTYPTEPTVDDGGLLKQFNNVYFTLGVPNGSTCDDAAIAQSTHDTGGELNSAILETFKTATLVN